MSITEVVFLEGRFLSIQSGNIYSFQNPLIGW